MIKRILVAAAFVVGAFQSAFAAVVAIGDEWTLSNAAYNTGPYAGSGNPASTSQFVSNMVSLFGGTNYLIASNNAYGYASEFENDLTANHGINVTRVGTDGGLTAALGTSDVVFLAGPVGVSQHALLHTFVANGGSVVVSAGTGQMGNAFNEAASWNPFLIAYGMQIAPVWTPIPGFTPVLNLTGVPSLSNSVTELLWGYGNQVTAFGANPNTGIISGTTATQYPISAVGVYATPVSEVPLPAGLPLILVGLGSFAIVRSRATKS